LPVFDANEGAGCNTRWLLVGPMAWVCEDVAALSKELEAAGLAYEIEVYSGAPHAFTVFGSQAYREVADKQSWEAFQDFLGTTLAGS